MIINHDCCIKLVHLVIMNETDRLADEQIKSHELCKRTDPSVAKPNSRQRLVFSFTLRPL